MSEGLDGGSIESTSTFSSSSSSSLMSDLDVFRLLPFPVEPPYIVFEEDKSIGALISTPSCNRLRLISSFSSDRELLQNDGISAVLLMRAAEVEDRSRDDNVSSALPFVVRADRFFRNGANG